MNPEELKITIKQRKEEKELLKSMNYQSIDDIDDYIDIVKVKCHTEHKQSVIEELLKTRKYAIPIDYKKMNDNDIPVGASKSGGYPDLPPSMPYPTFNERTEIIPACTIIHSKDCIEKTEEKVIHYPESAMQLVAQLRLEDIAKFDKDKLLPSSGILYFFWSGEIDPRCENPIVKVIYYDGDLSLLQRTKPTIPYYKKYYTEPLDSFKLSFNEAKYEYNSEIVKEIGEKLGEAYDYYEDFEIHDSKLFGYPIGVNNNKYLPDNIINLFQYDYCEGCLHSIYWHIDINNLKKRNFDNIQFDYDLD
ncbi:MAG: DUF1963 domain-containing protein [Ruminococcus sp.]|nr:DUF1963 domain-containing protein [Ruminococcus sp.]